MNPIDLEVYTSNNLENGNILLRKFKIDETKYIKNMEDNGDILLELIKTVNIKNNKEIKNYCYTNSSIIYCALDGKPEEKLKYKSILNNIYLNIGNGAEIIKKSKLNITTIKKQVDGFYFIEELGISIQCVDSNKCLDEIINICMTFKININLKIKLIDGMLIVINV